MENQDVSFRDRPINIDESGRRKWVYAQKPKGRLYRWRTWVSWLLLLFFVVAPFIRVNGAPLILLDIADRRFIIFGAIFWAQDTFILALLMLSFVLFVILFTVTFGRIWCGWLCPQTIFLEMVFRKIEFLIEGDAAQRRNLDAAPWSAGKLLKKTVKHSLFFLIAVMMSNVFLMWFIGSDKWFAIVAEPIDSHWIGFLVMLLVSAVFYWIYSYFREQICTMVCPYGRMQGVLLDAKTIMVSYDYLRGEPRGAKAKGDCIDCRQCLAVCPTAIDIRNGTQFECINCTACIDACNGVMAKVGKRPDLIRYDSAEGIEKGHHSVWNARNRAYSVVLLLLLGFFVYTLFTRSATETTILRTPGLLFQQNTDGSYSNVYNIKIVNKTHQEMELRLTLLSPNGKIEMAGNQMVIKDQSRFESSFVLILPAGQLQSRNRVVFGIWHGEQLLEKVEANFVGPDNP